MQFSLVGEQENWGHCLCNKIYLFIIKKNKLFVFRNVILVVGDGMSLTTATAARILRGQRRGQSGEDTDLAWDTFPAVALAKVKYALVITHLS